MFSKANVVKYSAVIVVLAAGFFFMIKGSAATIARSSANSYDDGAFAVNAAFAIKKVQASAAKSVQASTRQDIQAIARKSELNNYVLRIIQSYSGGNYPYLLNDDYENYNGVTENIFYKGALIAKANPDGSRSSHCVGLTYEVFFKAMKERNKEAAIAVDNFNNMTVDNMKDFLLTWYAAKGSAKAEGNQLAGAIVKYGLGTQIKRLEEAKAGDFIDFSRTKSGHTAVFIKWLRDGKGSIVGFKYWSTQESTNGIGYREEYFSDNPQEAIKGTVNRNELYIGRVGAIENYRAF